MSLSKQWEYWNYGLISCCSPCAKIQMYTIMMLFDGLRVNIACSQFTSLMQLCHLEEKNYGANAVIISEEQIFNRDRLNMLCCTWKLLYPTNMNAAFTFRLINLWHLLFCYDCREFDI